MSRFTYKGITEGGMTVDGVVEAFDEIEAMELARMQCRIVQAVNPVRESKNILAMDVTKPRVKPKVLAMLCAQLSTILGAGLPISRAIALVADQTTNKYLKRVLSEVVSDVSAGFGIADSLANKGDALPTVFIETIRAGEESGHLAEAFTRLHVYYDKRAKVAAKVSAALTYPIFVLIIASIVIMAMMVMVIPAMTGMISSLGGEMPLITQILINMSGWMSQNIVWVLLVMVLLIIGLKLYARTESGKTIFGLIKLKIPVLGVISVYSGAAQCANTLAMLIAAGLSMPRAVHIVSRVTDNHILSSEIGSMEVGLTEGKSLGECMETARHLPRTLIEMTAVGEQTGELEKTLETVGSFYDSETQRVTDRALSLMEPVLLILMAGFVGFIVVALYMPMFSMYASM